MEDNVEEIGLINKKINNPVIENNIGTKMKQKNTINSVTVNDVGIEKEPKTILQLETENFTVLTKQMFNNNSSSKLIENNSESSKISRHYKICNIKF